MQYQEHVKDGASFEAFVFKDFVVKVPKKRKHWPDERLDRMIAIQNYLAERVEGVLPCYRFGEVLVAPRAPGKRADRLDKDTWQHIETLRDRIVTEIQEHGYILKDLGERNVFYDHKTDEVYLYDFNNIEEKEKRGE